MDAGARMMRGDADEVRDLQARALTVLATRWTGVPGIVAGGAAPTDRRALEALTGGLAVLRRALPDVPPGQRSVDRAGRATGWTTGEGPTAAERARHLLAAAGETLGMVAEAARRAAMTLSVVGAEPAAEYADGVMTAASALRMLVELERDAIAAT